MSNQGHMLLFILNRQDVKSYVHGAPETDMKKDRKMPNKKLAK